MGEEIVEEPVQVWILYSIGSDGIQRVVGTYASAAKADAAAHAGGTGKKRFEYNIELWYLQ